MKSKKIHLLIIAFVAAFWLAISIWGGIKTSSKLAKKKAATPRASEKPIKPLTPKEASPQKPQSKPQEPQKKPDQPPEQPAPEPGKPAEQPAAEPRKPVSTAPSPVPSVVKQKVPIHKTVFDAIKKQLGFETEETESSDKPQTPVPTEASPILVRTFVVKSKDFTDILPVMGSVKAKTEVPLKFEINGVIKKIHFREGEKIKKGDKIVELDPTDMEYRLKYARSKFNAAQAAYNSVQKKLEVHKKLFDAGAIIKSKYEEVQLETESAKYQVESTRSEMELAENEFRKLILSANKDGVMGPKEAEEGQFVTPQDKVAVLYETEEVFVEVGVVERDINKVKTGQKARVYVDAYPATAFEATVDNIYPVVEGKSRTLTVKLKVENSGGQLMPGMFSRADIMIIELKDAIIVPTTTIITVAQDYTVVPIIPKDTIVKGDDESETGVVELQDVKTGYATSDYAQIIKGLQSGDTIVLESQGELKEKAKVKIIGKEEVSF